MTDKREQEHNRILEEGKGYCEYCGKSYTELLFEDGYSDIVLGGHYQSSEEPPPSWYNGIKILEM